MKLIAVATAILFTSASAFAPAPTSFGITRDLICLNAKHVQNKATKKHTKRRPKKRRPSDINRKKVEYPELPTPPAEFTVLDMAAVPVTKADFKMELNQ